MKKKAIIISCIVLVVLLLGGLTVVLWGNGNKENVTAGNNTESSENTEKVESTESTENIIETEDIVVDAGSEMDTIEGGGETEEDDFIDNSVNAEEKEEVKEEQGSTENKNETTTDKGNTSNKNESTSNKNNGSTSNKNESTSNKNNGNTSGNKDVVADSKDNAKAEVERDVAREYDSWELKAIQAGYRKVVYDASNNVYAVLMPNGEPATIYEAYAIMDAYFADMGYERVPTSCRGGWVNPEANQYLVTCGEIREKTTINDTPTVDQDEMSEEEFKMLYGEEAWRDKYGH